MQRLMILSGILVACQPKNSTRPPEDVTAFVDPFIGTGGHGHTYPGATTPFGMVQLSPDNGTEGWDWSSGYHYSDSLIAGFSHLHLSGTGIGDLADISFMPYYESHLRQGKRCAFSHENEEARPGSYHVLLSNGIGVSLSATPRTGYHQYRFPTDSIKGLAIDLGFSINWDSTLQSGVETINDTLLTGFRHSTGWAKDQRVYFAAAFSQPLRSHERVVSGSDSTSTRVLLTFESSSAPLEIQVGISSVSEEGALKNLQSEFTGWHLEQVVAQAQAQWVAELTKVEVEGYSPEIDTIFYTALYHAFLAPSLFSDVDGTYKGANGEIAHQSFERHSVFSLWDTFRAAHPLYTILQPARVPAMMHSMLAFQEEYGLLPVWALVGNETNTMTGYHAVPVLADALMKGHLEGNEQEVLDAMLTSANQTIRGTDLYRKYGYIPADLDGWSVTKTLEYAYDDWCIAQVAKYLQNEELYESFSQRSRSYRQLFDAATNFMRGKLADGTWLTPFDPFYSEHGFEGAYIEGTAWQHSWFVPHDVPGLIQLFGGKKPFADHLDALFEASSKMTGENVSVDITGLIGQYAHGNEPSHHVAYLYNEADQPWKTQERVRQIMETLYTSEKGGLSGNEDCGQMSAWYLFSALGFYPVNPASGRYELGSPMVRRARINMGNGIYFTILAPENGQENRYVHSVTLNGQVLDRTYIEHDEIMKGGILHFEMKAVPNRGSLE